jgi:hypothetical protein
MPLGLEDRLRIAFTLALVAAALFSIRSAHAVTIGNQLIMIHPVQKQTSIKGNFCNFATGVPTQAGGENGCSDGDGKYSVSVNGDDNILLNNNEDLNNQKTLLLSITLNRAGAMGFMPIMDQFPTVSPTYDNPFLPPGQAPAITPMAESWIPSTDLLQFEWTIFPQPHSEVVQLNSFNVMKNGVVTTFNVNWIMNLTMQSHCPEPASWVMMTIGFGLVGWSNRRQRAAESQAAR